jgi:hypothetical protein
LKTYLRKSLLTWKSREFVTLRKSKLGTTSDSWLPRFREGPGTWSLLLPACLFYRATPIRSLNSCRYKTIGCRRRNSWILSQRHCDFSARSVDDEIFILRCTPDCAHHRSNCVHPISPPVLDPVELQSCHCTVTVKSDMRKERDLSSH